MKRAVPFALLAALLISGGMELLTRDSILMSLSGAMDDLGPRSYMLVTGGLALLATGALSGKPYTVTGKVDSGEVVRL